MNASDLPVRKLVVVSQVFYPDEQATSQLLSGLLPALAAHGVDCEVLASFPAETVAEKLVVAAETWRGVRIRRGGLRLNAKRSLFWRVLGYASFSRWFAWQLLVRTPAEARVMVLTNPPFAPLLVWLCSAVRSWRYEVMLHDIYPDGLVAVGAISDQTFITCLWRWFNKLALRKARTVIVLGRDMARLVTDRYEVQQGKIVCAPNWSSYEPKDHLRAEQTDLWGHLKLEGKFVVQYSGNMGLWHDIECIVRAAELLKNEPQIFFLMIGEGRRRETAEQLSRKLGLSAMHWLPLQSQEQISDTLACCHAALVSQRAGLEGVAVPSKLYGILASGRAVLAQVPAKSEAALVVREEECGLVIQPGDAQGLADAIKLLAENHAEADAMGARAFAAYQAKYTLAAAVARFERAMTAPPAP